LGSGGAKKRPRFRGRFQDRLEL
jgi:hypothetical protein